MFSDSDVERAKSLIFQKFYFPDKPNRLMWTDEDSEPIEDLDSIFEDIEGIDYVTYGCTKLVLFPLYCDEFVIKIPFLGMIERDSQEKRHFGGACYYKDADHKTIKSEWDHCSLEEFVYNNAVKHGLGDMFCGTRCIGKIDRFPVYISERSGYALDEDFDYRPSEEGIKYSASKFSSDKDFWHSMPANMEPETLALFYDSWGKKLVDKLVDFLLDNHISDCHNGNVAFKDGKIRIIDYPGFYK